MLQKVVRAEQAFSLPGTIIKGYHQFFASTEAIATGDKVEVGYFVRNKTGAKKGEVEGARGTSSTEPIIGVVVGDHYINSLGEIFKYPNGSDILVQVKGYQAIMVDKKASTGNTTPTTGMKVWVSESDGSMKFSTAATETGYTNSGWTVSKGVEADITVDGQTVIEISNL